MGGLGPKKFSTFGPSDASRKKTIKFHLMQAIAFYSPCFCLSNRVWHEQIVLCTIVTDPNNFKCHGTIFAIFWHQKTHYFLERTHQNLTHRMHDATHCVRLWVYHSRACPHDNSPLVQARITKFGTKVQKTLVNCFWGWSTLTFKAKFNLKFKFTSFWACPPRP